MNRVLFILCIFLIGCSNNEQLPPIPRPKAYPRPTLYSAEYSSQKLNYSNSNLEINKSANFIALNDGWFNIEYPAYNITVNCTFTKVTKKSLSQVLQNRNERIALNLNGAYCHVTSWNGTDIIVANSALRTPVQFIATDSASFVLSGVAVANFPPHTRPDSVAPYINAVAADITHMLKHL